MDIILNRKNGKEIKIFAKTIEYDVFEQVKKLGNYEAYHDSKIRIMPDCHVGKGCTIGTTMTIKDKVTPNLVGVDIGCGMLTIKLKSKNINFKKLDNIINNKIPHGTNIHNQSIRDFDFSTLKSLKFLNISRAAKSIGSLGGGNHFIELNTGSDGELYLVIHSGSRNIGNQVAKYYQNLAWSFANEIKTIRENLIIDMKIKGDHDKIQKALKNIKKLKANKDLAHLEGLNFNNYLFDINIIQKYATLNRNTIADIIIKEMQWCEEFRFETIHNYIDINKMILRKGAVSSEKGELLLIPINMYDGSIIAKGKGNPDWNYSAPHGAGRLMSRGKAKVELNLDEFKNQMKDIYTTSVGKSTLDEAPNAYKSITEIIEMIQPTVNIIDIIKPIYNFKSH
jgi:RNA-splicing ligase RtcB